MRTRPVRFPWFAALRLACTACLAGMLSASPARAELDARGSAHVSTGSTQAPQARPMGYWLRTYATDPYAEYWHLNLTVADLGKAMAKSEAVLRKRGGEPVAAPSQLASSRNPPYQQLSWKLPIRTAAKALEGLRKLGVTEGLTQTPASNARLPIEVFEKRDKLRLETRENARALARLPATSALALDLLDHLDRVLRLQEDAKGRVLLNIELRQKAAP